MENSLRGTADIRQEGKDLDRFVFTGGGFVPSEVLDRVGASLGAFVSQLRSGCHVPVGFAPTEVLDGVAPFGVARPRSAFLCLVPVGFAPAEVLHQVGAPLVGFRSDDRFGHGDFGEFVFHAGVKGHRAESRTLRLAR